MAPTCERTAIAVAADSRGDTRRGTRGNFA